MRQSGVYWVVGAVAITVMICATVLTALGKMSDTGWIGVLTGLVTPTLMILLSAQNASLASQVQDVQQNITQNAGAKP